MFFWACIFSALSFYFFGWGCLFSPRLIAEFNRYKLAGFRATTGILQVLGATGLIVGLVAIPLAGLVASIGLAILMALGVAARIRIRDKALHCFPAFAYACLSVYTAHGYAIRIGSY